MDIEYDSSILRRFAQRLYDDAKNAVVWSVARWLVLGLIVATAAQKYSGLEKEQGLTVWGILLLLFVLVGYALGSARAFKLRLEAQRTMCQVAIEENTRRPAPRQ